nr:hypothetical protein L204_06283 [Cryptococcus depauperatus CBS 7855]
MSLAEWYELNTLGEHRNEREMETHTDYLETILRSTTSSPSLTTPNDLKAKLAPATSKARPIITKAPDACQPTPSERLDQLLGTISGVLTSNAASPTVAPIHASALTYFYHSAASLSPHSPHPRPPLLRNPPSATSSSFLVNHRHENSSFHRSESFVRIKDAFNMIFSNDALYMFSQQPKITSDHPLTAGEVGKLEDEWWSNEIVAAWYGPREDIISLIKPTRKSIHFGEYTRLEKDAGHTG